MGASCGAIADDETPAIDHDGGKARGRLTRLCALTRCVKPVDELIRFVRAPDGQITPDIKAVLPGRGVWLSARRAVIAEAMRKRLFSRALKAECLVGAELPELVDGLLFRRAREALSLANKAGEVVAGFAQVEAVLRAQPVMALLHAREAAQDGCRKLDRLLAAAGDDKALVSKVFASSDFDLALGRSNVIHAVLLDGSAARGCLARIAALSVFREGESGGGSLSASCAIVKHN